MPSPRYRTGPFLVDTTTGEISREGMRLKLRPQAFQVLTVLMARPGELVTREELIQQVWGQDTFVDYEQGLNFCVREVRKVLGDGADIPKYVETLARRGYRFIGSVEMVAVPPSKTDPVPLLSAQPAPAVLPAPHAEAVTGPAVGSTPTRRTGWRWAGFAAIAVLCVTVPLVAWLYRGGAKLRHTPPRIVVLPFANLTGDAKQEYLVRGVVEEITAQLGSIDPSSLAVIGRTSAEAIATHNYTVGEIAGQLDVDYVVEGSVRKEGEQLRITAQLIRSHDMAHVWAESYNRDAMKLFTVEQQVAASIVREIDLALGRDAKPNMPRRESANAEAMDEYMRGHDASNRFLLSVSGIAYEKNFADDYSAAEKHLRRAVELDPRFALAYADLAHLLLMRLGTNERQADSDFEGAEANALKALQIEPGLPEAHVVLARIAMLGPGNVKEARRYLDRALELNPSDPETLHALSNFDVISGDPQEAVTIAETLARLEPMDITAKQSLAYAYYMSGRYDEAITNARMVVEKAPNNFSVLMTLSHACYLKGDNDCAMSAYLATLQAEVNSDPSDLHKTRLADAARVFHQGGAKALQAYVHGPGRQAFLETADRNAAIRMIMIGETSTAIDLLTKMAADSHNLRSLRLAGYDPLLKPLENDSRGRALLDQIRLH